MRPYGILRDGELQLGLELEICGGKICSLRPHTGIPDSFVLSPAFVNAHSHLEYRGQQGRIAAESYWDWLAELTRAKKRQSLAEVRRWARLAAEENRRTGVGLIAEHSDRPVSGEALAGSGMAGIVYQEVLTIGEPDPRKELEASLRAAARNAASFPGPVVVNPHAYWTVDREMLKQFREGPLSIHVAESPLERECYVHGTGRMAEGLASWGLPVSPPGISTVRLLDELGLARPGVQFVHCCDVDKHDIALIAERGVSVAHCPRSNARLKCPPCPVRELLDAGVAVGLGMDSPASGGPIDMFAEMRAALDTACVRRRPLSAEEVWSMATSSGAKSLGEADWDVEVGSQARLLKLQVQGAVSTEDLILRGSPACVDWLRTDNVAS